MAAPAAAIVTTADALRAVYALILHTLESDIRTGTCDPKLPAFLTLAANLSGGRDTRQQLTDAAARTRAEVSIQVLESIDDTIAELDGHFTGLLSGQAREVFRDLLDESIEPGWAY